MDEFSLLATRNGRKSSIGAVSSAVDLATMKAQQAVAKHLLEGASPLGRAFFLCPGGPARGFADTPGPNAMPRGLSRIR
ncbi:hypothetical protein [Aquabacterium sp. OR-4]|uniref:hypothetical protein n=1 Tax=Aquabacterium sp. OR-4 TaxID=2978127 RepID=UPI0028CA7AA9|nr:hypothetical protein [Aquabacterium sp. OR-4]MDT7834523.1 hypothetical protein [Aquabacterium sp. OR-4]